VRMPERVDADSGPRRVRVRRVIQPWRSVALESPRAELERTIYPSEWISCTHQCRSNFRHNASGWSSEACDAHSAKAVLCLLCWSWWPPLSHAGRQNLLQELDGAQAQ
jgi:hypothetical protein